MRDCSTSQFRCAALSELEFHNNESFGKVLFGLAHLPEGLNIALLGKEFT